MGKYGGGKVSPAEFVQAWFQRRGITLDMERLQDRATDRKNAERERQRANEIALLDSVRAAASGVKRTRRQCEVAEHTWRAEPSPANLSEAMAAQRARYEAEQVLLARCDQDRGLMYEILKQV